MALIICARWGTDISNSIKPLFNGFQKLVGPELSFWCEYFGRILRLLATVAPGYGVSGKNLDDIRHASLQNIVLLDKFNFRAVYGVRFLQAPGKREAHRLCY